MQSSGRIAPRECEGVSPSLRAKRSNPAIRLWRYGLLRRFAPRNDGDRLFENLECVLAPLALPPLRRYIGPREAASRVRSHISPGPYRSFRELSLAGSVDPDIW